MQTLVIYYSDNIEQIQIYQDNPCLVRFDVIWVRRNGPPEIVSIAQAVK